MSANIKILVTGSNGQLGREINEVVPKYGYFDFVFTDIEELDITNFQETNDFLSDKNFTHIINCAAYTAVDKAETEPEKAHLVNVLAVKNLTTLSIKYKIKLVHISTDYVFDGNSPVAYDENAKTAPRSMYGKTKLEGENIILQSEVDALIIRTSWLYSRFGNNFVKTMIRLGRERQELNVVCDQKGTPTYAADLSEAVLTIIETKIETGVNIYHYSNEGECSWFDFAVEIMDLCIINCKVHPIETKDYPTAAVRPAYSLLDKSKIKEAFGLRIPHWKDSLKRCVLAMNG